jgi:YidC/Oxa1 family membrane protein insertase
MERRLLLVFALTFLIIMLFQPILKKYMPQPPAPQPNQQAQTNPAQTQAANNQPSGAAAMTPSSAAVPAKQAAAEADTVIENDLYRIVFTNRGAQVKSWVLKKWDDENGKPLDLVNGTTAPKFGYPLSLWVYPSNLDEGNRDKINSALYVATSTGSTAPADITFDYSDGDLTVHKTFHFDHSYVVGVQASVKFRGANVAAFPMWPSGFGDQITLPQYAASQIAYQEGSKVERLNNSSWSVLPSIKTVNGGTVPGPFQWAGVSDQYFAAIFMPADAQNSALVTLRSPNEFPHNPSDPNDKRTDKMDVYGAAVGSLKGPTETRLYVGPKSLADLEAVHVPGITGSEPDLRAVVDFGWWGLIARPLFIWLKWTYAFVHNWGWAILIQTVIINVALLPLRLSQMKSMLKMQRIAPQVKAIQEKYKKYSLRDPRKAEMNTEISALYKKEGVNPAGGCLPLLIQMPFLFAYYRMLGVAMDLRHAPWLWVHDLAAADPHRILPIMIVVTMFAMQRMTPQAGMDPSQQKMMNFMMPVMMGAISWNLPAGLGLYWSAGQLISIVQQAVMNRTSLGREMREMMAKRARKKDK